MCCCGPHHVAIIFIQVGLSQTVLLLFSAGAASLGALSRSSMRIYLGSWAPKPPSFSLHSVMKSPNLHRCAGNLGKIAALLGCHEDFTLAVLRAVRDHMSKDVGAAQTCGVDGCIHHPQQWSQSDIEDSNRPPSEAGYSDFTEIVISTQQNTITKDDEDAMEAAEVLEALSEANYYVLQSEGER
jgi:hypothetical protein